MVGHDDLDGPRTLRADELEAAHRLAVTCFGHSTLSDLPSGPYRPTSRQSLEVISYRGAPVSQIGMYFGRVSVFGSLVRIASIGGVGTHPDYRGLGLATRLLDHCMHELRARGARIMLVSGTRCLYHRAGCTPAQSFEPIVLEPGSLESDSTSVSIRPASVADAPLCARLYQGEPVHIERRVEEFQEHLESDGCGPGEDNWIVEAEREPVGYVFLSVPWGRRREDGVREVLLQGEYAGSRVALLDALAQLMGRLDLKELWMAVAWQDADLRQMIWKRGISGESTTMFGHTMRIVDFPGLLADLKDYVGARMTAHQLRAVRFYQDGDRYAIVHGPHRMELDGAAMTRLVLGPASAMETKTPVPAPSPGEIASQLFPLPSFLPGLNCR